MCTPAGGDEKGIVRLPQDPSSPKLAAPVADGSTGPRRRPRIDRRAGVAELRLYKMRVTQPSMAKKPASVNPNWLDCNWKS